MKYIKWLSQNAESLKGKTVAISGSTGGIGNSLCRYFAYLGADIILLDRNRVKADKLISLLKSEFNGLNITYKKLDLQDFENVHSITEEMLNDPPDYLILNAGIYHVPKYKTNIGYGNVFQVNYVSPYYMARTLKTVIAKKGGRIIVQGSIAYRYSKTESDDIEFDNKTKSNLVYGNSKRRLMFSLMSLDDGEGVIKIAHPGITFTNITAHYPKLIFALIKYPMKIIFMKTDKACLPTIKAMFQKDKQVPMFSWFGPKFFDIWGFPEISKLKMSKDELRDILSVSDDIYLKLNKW